MASPSETAPNYRADIDGLRAIAVSLVLLFHAFPNYCRAGFIGVDVFFVISGYLITGILLRRRLYDSSFLQLLMNFYEHRIRRIFPALIVILIASAIYGWHVLLPAEYESLTAHIVAGSTFITNFFLWSEAGYFDREIAFKPLMHLWSLAIEEQFYIIWPVLILTIDRIAGVRWCTLAITTIMFASLLLSIAITASDPTAAYYSPLSRGWELAAGGLLATLHAQGFSARSPNAQMIVPGAGLTVIVLGGLFLIHKANFPGYQAILPVAGTCAVIWFGTNTWLARNVLGFPPLVYLGLISYPLYLWHWVLLSFTRIHNPAPSVITSLSALAISAFLAIATYHFIEKPLRNLSLRKVSFAAVVGMVATLIFGVIANIFELSGIELTPTRKALSQVYDPRPAYRYKRCFLDTDSQTSKDLAGECVEAGPSTILIWGDSLAAQLYPGIKAQQDLMRRAIVQRTAGSCPPSAGDYYGERGNCNEINSATRRFIASHNPGMVIINGRWPRQLAVRNAQIEEIIEFLKTSNVNDIVLVGPAPDWLPSLRGILIRMDFPNEQLPEYLVPPRLFWEKTVQLDKELRELAGRLRIRYLSLVDHLCRADLCRIRVSSEIPGGLISRAITTT